MHRQYDIGDIYEHNHIRSSNYIYKVKLLLKYRKLHEALIEAEEGIDFAKKIGEELYLFSAYSFEVRIQLMMGDIKGAENSLQHANNIKTKMMPLFHLTDFLLSQFVYDLFRLEEEIKTGNKSVLSERRKVALKSGKEADGVSRKAAGDRTEILKLMGTYYWLVDKQGKATKWWSKSMAEGERLGARLELSRTYMEIGKRLRESKSKFKELNGIIAEDYLKKARVLFEEMDLQWDLDELDKIENVV